MIALDLETFLIRRPVAAPRPVCAQWCDMPPEHDLDGRLRLISDAREELDFWLSDGTDTIYGHNIAYDMTCLMAWDSDLIEPIFRAYSEGRVQDTLLNQKLIDIAHGELDFRKTRGYDLGTVAARYKMEVDKSDPWRLRYSELVNIPIENWPQEACEYAIRDATVTYRVAQNQIDACKAWQLEHGSPILHQGPARARADLALRLGSIWGVRTDAKRCEVVAEFTRNEIERMKDALTKETRKVLVSKRVKGVDIVVEKDEPLVRKDGSKNTKVVKEIVKQLFEARGEQPPMTDAGDISTEKDTMILAGAGWAQGTEERRLSEVCVTYAEYTTANNLLNRVEDLLKGTELPLQPRYDSLLETGRTSSSKGSSKKPEPGQLEGIQIQNFPRGFDKKQLALLKQLGLPPIGARECLVPREGNVFVLADYSSAELHTLAQVHIDLFGQSTLAEILNSGKDVHLLFGCEAYGGGVNYEDIKHLKGEAPYKDWRQSAKPIVFGRPGGMGPRKIVITARKSYGVVFDLVEAKRLIALYDSMIPEMPRYFGFINSALGGGERALMRQLRSGRWRGAATYSAMANSYFQGLAADGALEALYKVALECHSVRNSALYDFRIVAFVHDEIVLEGPEARANDAAHRLQQIMEHEMNVFTPDCPTPAEPVVTRVWSKAAKQVWDGEKRLVAWEPEWLKGAV